MPPRRQDSSFGSSFFSTMLAKAGCLAVLFSIGLIGAGINEIQIALANPEQVEISIEEFLKKPPESAWVKITGGVAIVPASLRYTRTKRGRTVSETLYIPIVPQGLLDALAESAELGETPQVDAKVKILVASRDPLFFRLFDELEGKSKKESDAIIERSRSRWIFPMNIEGVVRYGLNDDGTVRSKLGNASNYVDPNAAIIDRGKNPDLWVGMTMLAVGLIIPIGYFATRSSGGSQGLGRRRGKGAGLRGPKKRSRADRGRASESEEADDEEDDEDEEEPADEEDSRSGSPVRSASSKSLRDAEAEALEAAAAATESKSEKKQRRLSSEAAAPPEDVWSSDGKRKFRKRR